MNKKKIRTGMKQYIEENDNGEVDPTIIWDAMKAVIRGKFIDETACVKRVINWRPIKNIQKG